MHVSSHADVTDVTSVGVLTDDLAGGLEGQLDDALVVVGRRQVEDTEDVLPARLDVRCLRVDHLSDAAHHHVAYRRRSTGHNVQCTCTCKC